MHGADSDDGDRWADGSSADGREDRSRGRESQRHPQDEDRVYGITTAETSHTQEITRRQKQYILTMLVRVVSIIVVVCVPGISWPVKIGLCLVATIIPYVAVVRANGGPRPESGPTNLMLGGPRQRELGAAQRGLPGPGEPADFIVGERVFGERVFRVPPDGAPEADAEGDAARRASRGSTMGGADGTDGADRPGGAGATAGDASADGPVTPGQAGGDAARGGGWSYTAYEPEPVRGVRRASGL